MKTFLGYTLAAAVFVGGVFGTMWVAKHVQLSKAEANSIVPKVTFKELEQFKK